MGVQAVTVKEKDFQRTVLEYAKARGWLTAHFGNTVKIVRKGDGHMTIPDRGAAGFPDLVLVRPPRLLFVELKGQKGRLTEDQSNWLRQLQLCNREAFVWRPLDWPTIEATLK